IAGRPGSAVLGIETRHNAGRSGCTAQGAGPSPGPVARGWPCRRWSSASGVPLKPLGLDYSMFPDTATVTETGPGGQRQTHVDHGWAAVLDDGTPVRVFLTALVRTTKIPVLSVGQVIHVVRHPWAPGDCSVDPNQVEFVLPYQLQRRMAGSTTRE